MRRSLWMAVGLLLAVAVSTGGAPVLVQAAGVVVNSTADTPDANPGDGVCDDGGGACTLRAALQETNANANAPTVDFITFDNGGPGNVMNIRPATPLPVITGPLNINGLSASGSSCSPVRNLLISIEPSVAMPGQDGLHVTIPTGAFTISGVQIGGFGGAGLYLDGGLLRSVTCMNLGVNLAGMVASGNGVGLVSTGASAVSVGLAGIAVSNVISGNGLGIAIDSTTQLTVRSSYIGVGADGTTVIPNTGNGIRIRTSSGSIGSDTVDGQNVISGNGTHGVLIEATAATTTLLTMRNNTIGYAADRVTPRPNGVNGIHIVADNGGTISNIRIGELGTNQANQVYAAGNGHAVLVREADEASTISGVKLLGNRLVSETGIAVNLRPFNEGSGVGITDNDGPGLDADEGPNTLLNFPVLASVTSEQNPQIQLTYRSAANFSVAFHFYAVAACGPAGNRSMERWLGSTAFTTDENGFFPGSATGVSAQLAVGEGVVAVAQDNDGNTSEISNCVTATLPPPDIGSPDPRFAIAGQAGFTIQLESFYGPFAPGSKVTWAGEELVTTEIDDFNRSAFITAELVGDTARIVQVGVTGAGTVQFPVIRSSSDLDCTGAATSTDALFLLGFFAGLVSGAVMDACDLPPFPLGDANHSGATDLADVLHIRRELVDLDEPLPGIELEED